MNFLFILGLFLSSLVQAAPARPVEKNVVQAKRLTKPEQNSRFLYLNTYYFSFADSIILRSGNQRIKGRSLFSSFGTDIEYVSYYEQYFWSIRGGVLNGTIDVEKVGGLSYPRKNFTSLLSGADLGYRLNQDLDVSYGVGLYFNFIETAQPNQAFNNQINFKYRLSNRVTIFQSFGNFGAPVAYSYGFGLRWLL